MLQSVADGNSAVGAGVVLEQVVAEEGVGPQQQQQQQQSDGEEQGSEKAKNALE